MASKAKKQVESEKNTPEAAEASSLDAAQQTIKTLMKLGKERGFVTSGGRLRMAELREALIRYLSPIQHYPDIASIFDEAKNPRYPACLFYLEHATHSPLKHLLLWTFLFESLYDIKLLDRSFPKSRLMDRPATRKLVACGDVAP